MDATTMCALMLKAKRVFGSEKTFLSFPVSPIPFERSDLDFFDQSSAEATRGSIRNQINFAQQVNLIPTGEAWVPAAEGFLWDAYRSVLDQTQLAQSKLTVAEQAAYVQAKAIIRYENGGDTDAFKAYKQHRDAFTVLQEKYLAEKLTAESSNQIEIERWRSIVEPAMRAQLDSAAADWIALGSKKKVEDAQRQIVVLGSHSPSQMFAEWRSRCNSELDQLTDPATQMSAFATSYTPANAVDDNAWCAFTLSSAEIESLLSSAPTEWRRAMIGDAPVTTTQSVTFEFSSAGITRPWFDANALSARFWRFGDPSRRLSDGLDPPSGECVGYASGVVFARHVKTIDAAKDAPVKVPFIGLQFKMAERARQSVRVNKAVLSSERISSAAISKIEPSASHSAMMAIAADSSFQLVARKSLFTHMAPKLNIELAANEEISASNIKKLERLKDISIYRKVLDAAPQVVQPQAEQQAALSDETIYVLAFICKKLGKAPNPNEELLW